MLTVDQVCKLAQEHLAAVRAGEDPSDERQALRGAQTVKELAERYMEEHCLVHNKPSSAVRDHYILKNHILPKLGRRTDGITWTARLRTAREALQV